MECHVAARIGTLRESPQPRGEIRTVAGSKVPTYFFTRCSSCGRSLRVLVEQLGQQIACGHCGYRFVVLDADTHVDSPREMLRRADELLLRCARDRDGS